MKILLLGATGRTGKLVCEMLLKDGHQVTAMIRDATYVAAKPNLLIVTGSPGDYQTLLVAATACEAIISVLSISRRSEFPWAKLCTQDTFLSDTARNIIEVAKVVPLRKVIACSAWGVHETRKDLPRWFRWLVDNSNIGVAYRDHERQETLLLQSGLNVTLARPAFLLNSTRERTVQASQDVPGSLFVGRRDVARFMVNCLYNDTFDGRTPTVAWL